MPKAKIRYKITRMETFPIGYRYNVQKLVKQEGAKSLYYCGRGRFCRNLWEVIRYLLEK